MSRAEHTYLIGLHFRGFGYDTYHVSATDLDTAIIKALNRVRDEEGVIYVEMVDRAVYLNRYYDITVIRYRITHSDDSCYDGIRYYIGEPVEM